MTGAGQQSNKQTNKQTQRTFKLANIQVEKQKDIPTNRHTSRVAVDIRTKRSKQKIENEALCSAVIEINKQ